MIRFILLPFIFAVPMKFLFGFFGTFFIACMYALVTFIGCNVYGGDEVVTEVALFLQTYAQYLSLGSFICTFISAYAD